MEPSASTIRYKKNATQSVIWLCGIFLYTRATSQSPCLHETLATAAIT